MNIKFAKSVMAPVLLVLSMFFIMSFTQEDKKDNVIRISGTIKFPDNNLPVTVTQYAKGGAIVIDTIIVNDDNSFSKEVVIENPGICALDVQTQEYLLFWGENEDIHINFRGQDTAQMKVKNPPYEYMVNAGPSNQLMNHINYVSYISYQRMIEAEQLMNRASQSGNEAWIADTQKALDIAREKDYRDYEILAKMYPNANSAVFLLDNLNPKSSAFKELEAHLAKTKSDYAPYVNWRTARDEKEALLSLLEVGKPAPIFTVKNLKGKETVFKPSTLFKGKAVLIDFWASWCGPCRQAIPVLKQLYETYSSQGIEFVSISVDEKDADWKKALSSENMPWTQFQALNGGEEAMKLYQFCGIPHFVLLDQEGNIISRNLTVKKLEDAIKKVVTK